MCDPSWKHPLDTRFAKRFGARWNPPGAFGALYLNATVEVAAANARRNFAGEIATVYDLRPEQRPNLVEDAVTAAGLRTLRLPASYPLGVSHRRCQNIARRAYDAKMAGIACRSDTNATTTSYTGEELAIFDRFSQRARQRRRLRFAAWYPTESKRQPMAISLMKPFGEAVGARDAEGVANGG